MANDWIKLYRKLKDSPIWQHLNSRQRDIYINILLMANYDEKEWFDGHELVKISPGEFITSLPNIKKNCSKEVTIQNIRTCLLILEKGQFLTCKSTNQYRRIKVLNWGKYQGKDCELTGKLTDDQQATNRQLTATKEIKKLRNKESISMVAVAPDLTKKSNDLIESMKPIIQEFIDQGADEQTVRHEANKFHSYWTEPNKSKTRLRWEMEKTWDTKRRLSTWFDRIKQNHKQPIRISV